jgi:hypothetical protein
MTRGACLAGITLIVGCSRFDAGALADDAGAPEGGASGADAADAAGAGFCASRRDYDVCADFDDLARPPADGWDGFNGPGGAPATRDAADHRSPPASLRFDVAGAHSHVGLQKTVGPGTSYHVELAVRFGGKVQRGYVDIAQLSFATPRGTFVIGLDMQPRGMHLSLCPEDTSRCVYEEPSYDLQSWQVVAVDVDGASGRARVSVNAIAVGEAPFPASVASMAAFIGPREALDGNTLSIRYDDVLVSHR